jgi:hypothetical protein
MAAIASWDESGSLEAWLNAFSKNLVIILNFVQKVVTNKWKFKWIMWPVLQCGRNTYQLEQKVGRDWKIWAILDSNQWPLACRVNAWHF